MNSTHPRAQGGKGLLSHKISYRNFTNPWPRILPWRGRTWRGRRTPWRKEREGAYSIFYLYVVSARARAGAPLPFSLVSYCHASLSFLSKSPTKD